MLAVSTILSNHPVETVVKGTVLLRRSVASKSVIYIESGRVALGVLGTQDSQDLIEHQLGLLEGPCWLDATAAVLNLPSAVDGVALTELVVRRLSLQGFRDSLNTAGTDVQALMLDMARAHRQQTELTVSRLAKDAEARCAEWLLRHAEPAQGAPGTLAVMLRQRKRMIAAQLGIAPETLSRVLRQLRERSLISGTGRVLNLLDLNGLRALAGA